MVDDLYVPYVYPQDNGNRTDVRWVSLTNTRGMGLWATMPCLNFSAHRFTTEDIDRWHGERGFKRDKALIDDYAIRRHGANRSGLIRRTERPVGTAKRPGS